MGTRNFIAAADGDNETGEVAMAVNESEVVSLESALEASRRCETNQNKTNEEYFIDERLIYRWAIQQLASIESERAAQSEFNARVERALNMLRGPRESYRPILTDRDKILARICSYAKRTAAGDDERRSVPVWSVISDITGHGSGVSSAIYELYRERDEEEVNAEGGAS